MKPSVDIAEAGGVDVGVDLGRPDVGVAEKFLDGTDIRTMRKHMRGKAVPEYVRGDAVRGNPDRGGPCTDDLEDALSRKRPAEPRQEDMAFGEIAF